MAERFSKLYDELLQSYQEKMFNTSSLLKQLNEQFSWVSQLANLTQGEEPFQLQVTMVSHVLKLGPHSVVWRGCGPPVGVKVLQGHLGF